MVGRSGKSAAGEEEAAVLVLLASGLRALAGIAAGIAVAGSAHPCEIARCQPVSIACCLASAPIEFRSYNPVGFRLGLGRRLGIATCRPSIRRVFVSLISRRLTRGKS
jgi:hypothetical protein